MLLARARDRGDATEQACFLELGKERIECAQPHRDGTGDNAVGPKAHTGLGAILWKGSVKVD